MNLAKLFEGGLDSPVTQLGLSMMAAHGKPTMQVGPLDGFIQMRQQSNQRQDQLARDKFAQQMQQQNFGLAQNADRRAQAAYDYKLGEAQRQRDIQNKTMKLFEKAGRTDLVDYVGATGDMQGAWKNFREGSQRYELLTGDRAAQMGLPDGAYNMGPDGKISAIGGGGTNVTVNNQSATAMPEYNKLPSGMMYRRNPDGSIRLNEEGIAEVAPVIGGEEYQKRQQAEIAAQNKERTTRRYGNVVLDDIDRALEGMNQDSMPTTGPIGGALSNIPGTQSYDVGKLIETVKANAGFDRLQQMRDASPTGGALGQVSERELAYLQAAIGNLSQSQSKEQLEYNLLRVRDIYDEIINGPEAVRQRQAPQQGGIPSGVEADVWEYMTPEERALWQ